MTKAGYAYSKAVEKVLYSDSSEYQKKKIIHDLDNLWGAYTVGYTTEGHGMPSQSEQDEEVMISMINDLINNS